MAGEVRSATLPVSSSSDLTVQGNPWEPFGHSRQWWRRTLSGIAGRVSLGNRQTGGNYTYSRWTIDNEAILLRKSKQILKHFWADFVWSTVGDAKDEHRIGRRDRSQQAEESGYHSVA